MDYFCWMDLICQCIIIAIGLSKISLGGKCGALLIFIWIMKYFYNVRIEINPLLITIFLINHLVSQSI